MENKDILIDFFRVKILSSVMTQRLHLNLFPIFSTTLWNISREIHLKLELYTGQPRENQNGDPEE
jgi:hypothetical protein